VLPLKGGTHEAQASQVTTKEQESVLKTLLQGFLAEMPTIPTQVESTGPNNN